MIVDLSWPYVDNPDVDGVEPISVNAGIDMTNYPTCMTSIEAVLELINGSGTSSYLVKQDWADAYKHIHVLPDDVWLQAISVGGRIFLDRSLTFGCSSSPGTWLNVYSICLSS